MARLSALIVLDYWNLFFELCRGLSLNLPLWGLNVLDFADDCFKEPWLSSRKAPTFGDCSGLAAWKYSPSLSLWFYSI